MRVVWVGISARLRLSDYYLCKNVHRLRTTESSFQLLHWPRYLRLVFCIDSLHIQTGSDLITPAPFCLTPASFKLSIPDCLQFRRMSAELKSTLHTGAITRLSLSEQRNITRQFVILLLKHGEMESINC